MFKISCCGGKKCFAAEQYIVQHKVNIISALITSRFSVYAKHLQGIYR